VIRRRWSIPLAVLAVTGALALAAPLAAATGTTTDLQRIQQSGQALIKSGSARFAGRVTISSASTTSGTVSLSGAFDFQHRQGQFNIDAAALGASAGSGRLTFRLVNNVAYLSVGSFRSLTHGTLPAELDGKQWIKIDLSALGASAGSLNEANPSSSLDYLHGVTSVQNLGPQPVSGVPATHYRVELDLTTALANLPANERSQVQSTLGALGGTGTFPADVWLDAKGRPVKLSIDVIGQGATPTHLQETFQYSDFGTPVQAPVPPSSQTVDFTKLVQQLGGSLGGSSGVTTTTGPAA